MGEMSIIWGDHCSDIQQISWFPRSQKVFSANKIHALVKRAISAFLHSPSGTLQIYIIFFFGIWAAIQTGLAIIICGVWTLFETAFSCSTLAS